MNDAGPRDLRLRRVLHLRLRRGLRDPGRPPLAAAERARRRSTSTAARPTPSRPARTSTATRATTTSTATGTRSRPRSRQHITTQTDTFNVGDVDTSLVRLFTARIETGEFDAESQVPWVQAARARLGGTTWVSNPSNNAITETPQRLAQAQQERGREPGAAEERQADRRAASAAAAEGALVAARTRSPSSATSPTRSALYTGGYSSIQSGAGAANNVDAYTGIKSAVQRRDPDAQVDYYPGVTGGTDAASLTTVDPATIAAVEGLRRRRRRRRHRLHHRSEDHDRTHLAAARRAGVDDQPGRGGQPEHRRLPRDDRPGRHGELRARPRPALLWSSYNGQRQGDALADVLLGKVEPVRAPAVHLVPPTTRQLPRDHRLRDPARPPATPGRTYMYFTGRAELPVRVRPQLHHVRLLARCELGAHSVDAEGTITATADVTNTGSRAGTAVPQLYATTPFAPASAQRPAKRLMAFAAGDPAAGQEPSGHLCGSRPRSWRSSTRPATGSPCRHGTYGLQLANVRRRRAAHRAGVGDRLARARSRRRSPRSRSQRNGDRAATSPSGLPSTSTRSSTRT